MTKYELLDWMLLTNNTGKTKLDETNFRIEQKPFNQQRFGRRFQRPSNGQRSLNIKKCFKCGSNTIHSMKYNNIQRCKAVGKKCAICNKEGHLREMCKKQNAYITRKFLSKARMMKVDAFENQDQLYEILDENEGVEEDTNLYDDSSIAELENMFTVTKETNYTVTNREED